MCYYSTRLKMLPVCDCGYILKDGIVIHKNILEVNELKYPNYFIEPPACPNCKRKIECIEHYNYVVESIM